MNCGGLGIPDPRLLAERANQTSKASSEVFVGSLLGGTNLNYVEHKGCVHIVSADRQKKRELAENTVLFRQNDQADGAGLTHLSQATENGGWITAILHRLNRTELSWE